ncbi:MAG: DNA methyltransferase [Longimicrobiales bacterium]
MSAGDGVLSSQETADRLGYTRQHVRRLIRTGQLRGHKVARDWVVDAESVDRYIAALENHELQFAEPFATRAPREVATDGLSVTDIMTGGEASLDLKRHAKRMAWANGDRPDYTTHAIRQGDARVMDELSPSSVHLIVTSPPYFDLVEYEAPRGTAGQIGNLQDYRAFLDELDRVWRRCFDALAPGGRMCIVVGDVCLSRREAGRHHVLPLHADIGTRCREVGFDYLTPILWSKIANMSTEVAGAARFLGKPYEPNAVIKNDTEYILMLRKPGSYRRPTAVQRALSLRVSRDFARETGRLRRSLMKDNGQKAASWPGKVRPPLGA